MAFEFIWHTKAPKGFEFVDDAQPHDTREEDSGRAIISHYKFCGDPIQLYGREGKIFAHLITRFDDNEPGDTKSMGKMNDQACEVSLVFPHTTKKKQIAMDRAIGIALGVYFEEPTYSVKTVSQPNAGTTITISIPTESRRKTSAPKINPFARIEKVTDQLKEIAAEYAEGKNPLGIHERTGGIMISETLYSNNELALLNQEEPPNEPPENKSWAARLTKPTPGDTLPPR